MSVKELEMRNADFLKAHDRVKDFDWKFSYEAPPSRYAMPYKIPVKTSDPFRHLIRDYCKAWSRDKRRSAVRER